MQRRNLPAAAFIDPRGSNRAAVDHLAHRVLTLLLTHLQSAASLPPMPYVSTLPTPSVIPRVAVGEDELIAQISTVLSTSMNAAHPAFIGHMDSMPTLMSVLGELVTTAINNNMLSLEMSPMLSRVEGAVLKAFAALFGLGPRAGGVLLSGGSLANLQALTVARNCKFAVLQQGLVGLTTPPVLFASEVAHTSLQKAAMLLGLGMDAVIPVKTNAHSQMEVHDLQHKIEQAKQEGKAPFCVVATAGTTVTGNIDPIPAIREIADQYDLWLHVDAAYGGALVLSDQQRSRLVGIAEADSITFNPQKWLYIAKTCAMVLFSDMTALDTAFRVQAPYMRDTHNFTNLGEISVQGTRHADILKLWLSVQHLGMQGYAQLVDESYRLTAYVLQCVQHRSFLQIAAQPEMNILCFRGVPTWVTSDEWDTWNANLQAYLLAEGTAFVSLPLYRGQRWLRLVLLNPYTDEATIDTLFEKIDTFAEDRT